MEIKVRTIGNCQILDLYGQLVLGAATMKLRTTVHEAAKTNHGRIVVNLGKVAYMDTPGLGELVGNYSHVKKLGRKLVLLNPQDKTMSLLIRTKLEAVFDIFHDEASAVSDSRPNAVPA